jgi:hypothetical protein
LQNNTKESEYLRRVVKKQCITRVYAVNSIDEDGWVSPSNIQILDKINIPTNNVYISNDFILKRHKEVIISLP